MFDLRETGIHLGNEGEKARIGFWGSVLLGW